MGTVSTGLLFFINQGDWLNALIVFALACVGYNCAELFYNALLVDVAEKEKMDMVSSMGYSLGYLGCGILFVFNVFMVQKPSMFRLDSAATAIRTSFMSASLWWILFSIPLFVFVREPVYTKISGVMAIFKDSLSRLRKTTLKILNTTILFFSWHTGFTSMEYIHLYYGGGFWHVNRS